MTKKDYSINCSLFIMESQIKGIVRYNNLYVYDKGHQCTTLNTNGIIVDECTVCCILCNIYI